MFINRCFIDFFMYNAYNEKLKEEIRKSEENLRHLNLNGEISCVALDCLSQAGEFYKKRDLNSAIEYYSLSYAFWKSQNSPESMKLCDKWLIGCGVSKYDLKQWHTWGSIKAAKLLDMLDKAERSNGLVEFVLLKSSNSN